MATFTESTLSGSTSGKPVPVVATATLGTTLHTAGASGYDKVWLWASNVTAIAATLTIEWGGATDPGEHMVKAFSIPPNSLPIPIASGQIIRDSLLVTAFSGTASAINVSGYVIAVR